MAIYLILQKTKSKQLNDYQKDILNFFKNYQIKIIVIDLFFENLIEMIDRDNDFVFFDKDFAYNNIDVVKSMQNGIVILPNETVYLRKINKLNPINETMAINHNFQIIYLKPLLSENTNDEWKIIVHEKNYIFNLKNIEQWKISKI